MGVFLCVLLEVCEETMNETEASKLCPMNENNLCHPESEDVNTPLIYCRWTIPRVVITRRSHSRMSVC